MNKPDQLKSITQVVADTGDACEAALRWNINEDARAIEKLAAGIRAFARDQEKPESRLMA